ncbi:MULTISPECIES: DUF192 domain-containing protein [unclassified Paracoccus (in: a-proteobacteria)]|uniref:DUF192 domain-containing protein n=1 Tax=unclassified Paracoccus (in: a-proteobacteria) TaxID=2688777 RepID=UPI0015FF9AA8|nr:MULTISPECIES: DUF192 domain-containing protein [unclassified Paracoccus (in: a-proteobacteria)]MBB1490807.1 DUF192 domain-containing protein [Paracoccus sp. MC1854]MBB1497849.1 DUF192 domain-containing protein [Paracoccus sp. MC1862]QQO45317.1 DUF192 domain-containing protein [Paracoccus sp. MC1862]
MNLARTAALAVMAALAGIVAAQAADCSPGTAVLTTPQGTEIRVAVEIADDPAERAQGLMWRKDLPAGQGMLFVYEAPQPVSFWMKNTLIPLDILFFDARGVLRHVHPQARPLDLGSIPGAMPGDPAPDRLLVLEIGGAEAARRGLVPGTVLSHPAVPQSGASIPCD